MVEGALRASAPFLVLALVACGGSRPSDHPPPSPANPGAVAALFDAIWAERSSRVAEAVTVHATTNTLVTALSESEQSDRRSGAYSSLTALGDDLRDDRVIGPPGLAVAVDTEGRVVCRNRDPNRMVGSTWDGPLVGAALAGSATNAVIGMNDGGSDLSEGWERIGMAAAAPVRDSDGAVIGALFAAFAIESVGVWSERLSHDVLLLHHGHRTTNLGPPMGEQAEAALTDGARGVEGVEIELAGRARVGARGHVGDVGWVLLRHLGVVSEPTEVAPLPPLATPGPRPSSGESPPEAREDGLTVERDGPAPIPDVEAGDENLLGIIAIDGAWHAVIREEVEEMDGDDEEAALYASTVEVARVRPLRDAALGEPAFFVDGPVEAEVRVLPGPTPWLLSSVASRRPIVGRELAAGSSATTLFTLAAEHMPRSAAFHVGRARAEGVVLTERAVFATDERPRQIEQLDERGQREYVMRGPRPTHREIWGTWIGRRTRERRLLRVEHRVRAGGHVVASRTDGVLVGWWVQTPSDDETAPPTELTVARFDARGRERWRRDVTLPRGSADRLRAVLTEDGSAVVSVFSAHERALLVYRFGADGTPEPVRRVAYERAPDVRFLECGSSLHLITVEGSPSGAQMRLARRVVPPSGAIGEPTTLYSLRVSGMPSDEDAEEGYEPPSVAPTSMQTACAGDRAAVAFDSPYDRALFYGAPRGVVFIEWPSP